VFLTLKDFVKQSIFTQVILDHTASLDLFLFFKVINYDVHTYSSLLFYGNGIHILRIIHIYLQVKIITRNDEAS